MTSFYKPFTLAVRTKPLIVYPCIGLEKVLERGNKSIEMHLVDLYSSNSNILSAGTYYIVILWDESTDDKTSRSTDVMTDIWIFDKIESWGAGPLVDVKTFRNNKLESSSGISTGDGLLMLGKEEEFRRNSKNLESYLHGNRPKLPEDITPVNEF